MTLLKKMIKLRYPFAKRYPLGPLAFGAFPNWLKRIWGKPHNGIDIVAPEGTPILAAHDGLVVYASADKTGSNTVILRSGISETLYGHLRDFSVGYGVRVKVGQKIGSVGRSGVCTGPHLHFAVRKVMSWKPYRVKYLNPHDHGDFGLKPVPKPTPASPVQLDGEFYTVQRGGWRSEVIQEIINAGIWKGSWQDWITVFNALNPKTPKGGWRPGDKVSIMKLKPKPVPKPKTVVRICGKCGHKHLCPV